MEQPSVSIIVPLINDEKRVSRIIRNLLNQKLPLFEILCIDGDSTDKTIEIAKEFAKKDNRVKIFLSYKKTVGGLLNHGLSIAKGRYITIINKNKTLKRDSLDYLYNLTQINYIDIVQGSIINNNSSNESNSLPVEKAFKLMDYPEFLDIPSIYGSIYKRSFLIHKKIRFLEDDTVDYEKQFFIEAALKSDTIKYTKKRCHLKNENSIDNSIKLNISTEGMLNLLEIRNNNSNNPNIKEKLLDILFNNMNIINEKEKENGNILSYESCQVLQESLKYVNDEYVSKLSDDDKYLYYKYRSPLTLSISKNYEKEMKVL